jgi:2-hydroxy-3-keto-5-methylthiopentenyl-1-phosphate phosphatase
LPDPRPFLFFCGDGVSDLSAGTLNSSSLLSNY